MFHRLLTCLLFGLLFLTVTCGQAFAEFFPASAVRDSIGVDGTLTDGLPGASTAHEGGTWNTPGMVVDVAETGNLAEVQMVILLANLMVPQ